MTFDPLHIIAPDGPIARRLGQHYEHRPQQARMMEAVQQTLREGGTLIVEAGTGVGKSFGYLLPAIQRIVEARAFDQASKSTGRGRVVVSTHTIALQEQLIHKDIPLLQAVLGEEFSAVLVKGRGNYVSLRRLARTVDRDVDLLTEGAERRTLEVIEAWARDTTDGSLASLPMLERSSVWARVQSDAEDCMGRRCENFQACFYQSARRRMENADLLVVNHALFFADLALRAAGGALLPPYDHVVLDEAHQVENVAGDHFGLSVSRFQVRLLLSTLLRPPAKGLLPTIARKVDVAAAGLDRAMQLVEQAYYAADEFFDALAEWQKSMGRGNGRVNAPGVVENSLSPVLRELSLVLKQVRDRCEADDDRMEVEAMASRAFDLAASLTALIDQTLEDNVYWLEVGNQSDQPRVKLTCAPVEVGPLLRQHLFGRLNSDGKPMGVVLTSATLSTADAAAVKGKSQVDPFAHLRRRLGADEARTLLLGSPFDYQQQARLIVDPQMPEPNDPRFLEHLCPRILEHIDRSDGGAFVLFTSFDLLRKSADWLRPFLQARQMPMLVHGEGEQRSVLLDRFRADRRSVLLGADSFWQGVDVRGEALRTVIITRLPFDPPDVPLIEARIERIKARGGNAFAELSLPSAILKFKQGFGRLIRSRQDTGCVVVLDSRIVKRSYGKKFVGALPPLPVKMEPPRASAHGG